MFNMVEYVGRMTSRSLASLANMELKKKSFWGFVVGLSP